MLKTRRALPHRHRLSVEPPFEQAHERPSLWPIGAGGFGREVGASADRRPGGRAESLRLSVSRARLCLALYDLR